MAEKAEKWIELLNPKRGTGSEKYLPANGNRKIAATLLRLEAPMKRLSQASES